MIKNERWFHSPSTVSVARAIGKVTFSEVIRDKILYNVILCAFVLFFMGFFASRLNFLHPERIVLDFGLLTVNLSCSMIAILIGAGLIPKEFERRTIYVALSRPISKQQFVFGKFVGLMLVLVLNWCLQCLSYLVLLSLSSETLVSGFSWTLTWALFFVLIQSMMLGCIAILFSTFTTTSLSIVFTLGFYLIGNSISQLRLLGTRLQSGMGRAVMEGAAAVLPNFEHFNLGYKVTYGLPLERSLVGLSTLYGFFVIALCLALAGLLIRRREI